MLLDIESQLRSTPRVPCGQQRLPPRPAPPPSWKGGSMRARLQGSAPWPTYLWPRLAAAQTPERGAWPSLPPSEEAQRGAGSGGHDPTGPGEPGRKGLPLAVPSHNGVVCTGSTVLLHCSPNGRSLLVCDGCQRPLIGEGQKHTWFPHFLPLCFWVRETHGFLSTSEWERSPWHVFGNASSTVTEVGLFHPHRAASPPTPA